MDQQISPIGITWKFVEQLKVNNEMAPIKRHLKVVLSIILLQIIKIFYLRHFESSVNESESQLQANHG
jgi:hypothetical protein